MLDDGVHCVGDAEPVSPVVVRNSPVVLADGQNEPGDALEIELGQSKEIVEHVHGLPRFLHVVDEHEIQIEPETPEEVKRNSGQQASWTARIALPVDVEDFLRQRQHLVDLALRAGAVVGEYLEGDFVLLLGLLDLVEEVGVVESQPAVHGEHLEVLLVLLESRSTS